MGGFKPQGYAQLSEGSAARLRPSALCSPAGEADPASKPLKGFGGASVIEIVSDYRGDTWRAVYTVRYADAIYVLHVFQKKSKKGAATQKSDIDLIRRRMAEVERLHRANQH